MQRRIESTAIALLMLSAALPAVAVGMAAPAEALSPATFVAPREPLVLTRTVWRTLHDGQQIMVRRSYLLDFTRDAGGFVVTGQQLSSEVEAPAAIDAIARIERNRTDLTAFPLRLDASGMIRTGTAPAGSSAYLDGGSAARALMAGAKLSPIDQRAGEAFLADIAARGGVVPWPSDLFNPRAPSRTDQREVALPDGSMGKLTMTLSAEAAQAGGLPSKVSREVVSEVGGTRRVSREEWTFAPRTGP
jgi:hypothetical protein